MAGQNDFPVLFTIDSSNRHEVILVNAGNDLHEVRALMETASSSPNCAEFMARHRSKDVVEKVGEIKVKWSGEGRDRQLFPKATVLTEENCEAVLRMMSHGVGRDVFDVTLVKGKAPEPAKK
ncbi:hypothetical protein LTR53_017866 [Teratosphaeriaceae sp. CCFEE 6253]|nr:hypothetical protein LTR53_017866 [Teratosphaeriaceae sp. CCFEE 6253]